MNVFHMGFHNEKQSHSQKVVAVDDISIALTVSNTRHHQRDASFLIQAARFVVEFVALFAAAAVAAVTGLSAMVEDTATTDAAVAVVASASAAEPRLVTEDWGSACAQDLVFATTVAELAAA